MRPVLRKHPLLITSIALHWTPEGKRKRGRPRTSWRRTAESKIKAMQQTWGSLTKLTKDRQKWRKLFFFKIIIYFCTFYTYIPTFIQFIHHTHHTVHLMQLAFQFSIIAQ
jgi:hypothetical protein